MLVDKGLLILVERSHQFLFLKPDVAQPLLVQLLLIDQVVLVVHVHVGRSIAFHDVENTDRLVNVWIEYGAVHNARDVQSFVQQIFEGAVPRPGGVLELNQAVLLGEAITGRCFLVSKSAYFRG